LIKLSSSVYCASDPAVTALQFGQLLDSTGIGSRLHAKKKSGDAEMAAEAQDPNLLSVTAKSLVTAPGAIVCPDYNKVGVVFDMYNNAWGDSL
jgi:hypothetical protein